MRNAGAVRVGAPFVLPLLLLIAGPAGLSGCGPKTRFVRPGELTRAVDLSATEPAEETYLDGDRFHLGYVLDEEQSRAYAAASPDERREMLRIVWASLDPTPTTPRNERKVEHYRRLAYVRENFRIPGDPGWDRRGELLLRYGSPQVREFIAGDVVPYLGLIPPKEVWVYTWLEMAFRLEDSRLTDNFQDSSEGIPSSRPDAAGPNPDDGNLFAARPGTLEGIDAPADLAAESAAFRSKRMLGKGFHALREGTQAHLFDHGGGRLDYVFDVLNFAGTEPGRTAVEINFLLDSDDLAPGNVGGREVAEIEVEVVAKTRGYREVDRSEHTMRSAVAGPGTEGVNLVDQTVLQLEPGDYRLALSVRDAHSRDVGIFTTETTVRDFLPGDLAVSDIQLASDVRPGVRDHRFSKGDLLVVPNPARLVRRGETAFLYFEIYGLELSRTDAALYSVELTIRRQAGRDPRRVRTSKGDVLPGISTEYFGRARARAAQEHLSLDTSTMESGVHEIEIAVLDLVSDRSTKRRVALRVVEAGASEDADRNEAKRRRPSPDVEPSEPPPGFDYTRSSP